MNRKTLQKSKPTYFHSWVDKVVSFLILKGDDWWWDKKAKKELKVKFWCNTYICITSKTPLMKVSILMKYQLDLPKPIQLDQLVNWAELFLITLYQTIILRYKRIRLFRAVFLRICYLGFPDWWSSYSLVFTNKCLWEFLKKFQTTPKRY